ncbi:MAG TPA: alpha/beta hydrolase-fold protein [Anaerolineales bacterium]|nr:alpha/beta hydrolase-fold protein [Anaerolineales bacterium]
MSTRQAIKLLSLLLLLPACLYACSPLSQPVPTVTPFPPTSSPIPQATPASAPVPTSTITPLACLTNPGRVEEGSLDSTNPAQEFRIYLPPCYDEKTDQRYPVLYLLHGQTYTDDQWIRLGAVDAIDHLILSGESIPFIIAFPDDRYWNLPPGPGFGQRLVDELIPYIDSTYRTFPDRNHRAIGGMSRGAGWALRLGLTHWDLFGTIGLHSLAVLQKDASRITDWLADIPPPSRPRVFMDIGDNDPELTMAGRVESDFNDFGLPHEWHLYSGAHTEEYWSAHVEEYMQWYAAGWNNP